MVGIAPNVTKVNLSALWKFGLVLAFAVAFFGCSFKKQAKADLTTYAQQWIINADPHKKITDEKILRFLAGRANSSASDFRGENCTALHVAAKLDDGAACVRLLGEKVDLSADAEVLWKEPGGDPMVLPGNYLGTPFHCALRHGSIKAVRAFLGGGIDPKQLDRWGQSTLALAAMSESVGAGPVEVVKALIEAGADVNAVRQNDRTTPLLWAAMKGNTAVMEVLLQHGADIGAKDFHGYTALHRAAQGNHAEAVKFLLAHGADASARTYPLDYPKGDEGSLPLIMSTNEAIRELLRNHALEKKDAGAAR